MFENIRLIFTVFKPALDLFKQGKELANPSVWKQRTIAANILAGCFATVIVIVKGLGYDIGVSQEVIDSMATSVVAFVAGGNAIMHAITSKRAGLPADSEPATP